MRAFFFYFFILLGPIVCQAQAITYVNGSASNSGDGTSWQEAKRTIGEGIDAAEAAGGAEVWIAEGSYSESITLVSNVSLYGGFQGSEASREDRPDDTKSQIDVEDLPAPVRPVLGVGVRNVNLERLELLNGRPSSNEDDLDGGGLYLEDVDESVAILDCEIYQNVGVDGGGVYLGPNASPRFLYGFIRDNTARRNAGGLFVSTTARPDFRLHALFNNGAGESGGAIYSEGATVVFQSGLLLNNSAGSNGQGIAVSGGAFSILDTAIRGGGISAFNSAQVTIEGTMFQNNSGGAIRLEEATIDLSSSIFESNGASQGAAIRSLDSTGFIRSSSFFDGASGAGGAFAFEGAAPDVEDCIVWANSASVGGGAALSDATVTFTRTIFAVNEATTRGGAIAVAGSSAALFDRCRFVGNFGDGEGTIQARGGDTVLENCLISGNAMDEYSGIAITGPGTSVRFRNTTTADNVSGTAYGSLISNGATATISNSILAPEEFGLFEIEGSGEFFLDHSLAYPGTRISEEILGTADLRDAGVHPGSFRANPQFLLSNRDSFDDKLEASDALLFRFEQVTFEEPDFQTKTVTARMPGLNAQQNELVGRTLSLTGFDTHYVILENTEDAIVFAGRDAPSDSAEGYLAILDYRVQPQSLAVDAGNSADLPGSSEDIDGLARVVDTAGVGDPSSPAPIDIGAYEQRQNTSPAISNDMPVYVNVNATGANDGSSWVDGYETIVDAVADPRAGTDPIWIASGVYELPGESIQIRSGNRLFGAFAEGDLDYSDQDATLKEVEFEAFNFTGSDKPSLITVSDVSGVLFDTIFFHDPTPAANTTQGALLEIRRSDGVTINNSVIEGFESRVGGGAIVIVSANNIKIQKSIFRDGRVSEGPGGAIRATNIDLIIDNCLFTDLQADEGGAIALINSEATIRNSEFEGNTGNSAGSAMIFKDSSVLLENSILFNNEAFIEGGTILSRRSSLTIRNSDFSRNDAEGGGGGVISENPEGEGSLVVENSRFAGNLESRTPQSNGAVITTRGGEHRIENSIFVGNSSSAFSTVFRVNDAAEMIVVNSTIAKNDQRRGDRPTVGYVFGPSSSLSFFNTIFEENESEQFKQDDMGTISLTHCLFKLPENQTTVILEDDDGSTVDSVEELNSLSRNSGNLQGSARFLSPFDAPREFEFTVVEEDEKAFTTTYISPNFDLVPGDLKGQFLFQFSQVRIANFHVILDNTENSITIYGLDLPDFESPWNILDYRLPIESIAVDAGIADGAPASDIAGNPRPVDVPGLAQDGPGQGFDIGAYEQQTTSFPSGIPDVVYVAVQGSDNNDGSSWASAYATMQRAIDDPASATRPIWVEAGDYPNDGIVLQSDRRLVGGFEKGMLSSASRGDDALSNILPPPFNRNAFHLVEAVDVSNIDLERFGIADGNANGAGTQNQNGGGLYIVNAGGTNVIRDSEFSRNSAENFGGTAYIRDSAVRFEDSDMITGSAGQIAGGLFIEGNSEVFFSNARFQGTSSTDGGSSIFITGNSALTLDDVFFTAGSTEGFGGHLLQEGGTVTATDVDFVFGAGGSGGFIAQLGGTLNLDGFTMENGNATDTREALGGGFYQEGGTAVLRNGVIDNCSASAGAAIASVSTSEELVVEDVTFLDNISAFPLVGFTPEITLTGNTFLNIDNGYIRLGGEANALIEGNTFSSLTDSLPFRGVIFVDGGETRFVNNRFFGSSILGGLINFDGGIHEVINNTFEGLTLNDGGGVVIGEDAASINVSNNIVKSIDGQGLIRRDQEAQFSIDNNMFFTDSIYNDEPNNVSYTFDDDLNAEPFANDNIFEDPLFADEQPEFQLVGEITAFNGARVDIEIQTEGVVIRDFLNKFIKFDEQRPTTRYVVDTIGDSTLELNGPITTFIRDIDFTLADQRPVGDSPAIDNALASIAPETDFAGRERPREIEGAGGTNGFDIGAFETYPARIASDPEVLDFGDVFLTDTQLVDIINRGDFPLKFTGSRAAIVADTSGSFSLPGPPLPDLRVGNFFPLQVQFTPSTPGPKNAVLLITSNDPERPNLEIPLRGNGTATNPQITEILSQILGFRDDPPVTNDTNNDNVVDAADLVTAIETDAFAAKR